MDSSLCKMSAFPAMRPAFSFSCSAILAVIATFCFSSNSFAKDEIWRFRGKQFEASVVKMEEGMIWFSNGESVRREELSEEDRIRVRNSFSRYLAENPIVRDELSVHVVMYERQRFEEQLKRKDRGAGYQELGETERLANMAKAARRNGSNFPYSVPFFQAPVSYGYSAYSQPILDMSRPVHVRSYTRADGTHVRAHTRSR